VGQLAAAAVRGITAGEDPGYDDDFQQMREEVNKLSGADTELICRLAEKLLTTTAKDIRVATYYCWAKLHREGEQGLAEGLELLAGLLERFGTQLHPQRDRSRKAALEWLAGSRMTDSLSLYPEVVRIDAMRTTGALLLIAGLTENEPDENRPELNALYGALESRLQKAGAWMRWYRRTPVPAKPFTASHSDAPAIGRITSGQDLLAQARTLTEYCASSRTAGCQHTI
jgi:type VI secretion system protein VasJ